MSFFDTADNTSKNGFSQLDLSVNSPKIKGNQEQ
jgi:hypothetical protein